MCFTPTGLVHEVSITSLKERKGFPLAPTRKVNNPPILQIPILLGGNVMDKEGLNAADHQRVMLLTICNAFLVITKSLQTVQMECFTGSVYLELSFKQNRVTIYGCRT